MYIYVEWALNDRTKEPRRISLNSPLDPPGLRGMKTINVQQSTTHDHFLSFISFIVYGSILMQLKRFDGVSVYCRSAPPLAR